MRTIALEQVVKKIKHFCKGGISEIKSDEELIEKASWMFHLRSYTGENRLFAIDEITSLSALMSLERKSARLLHHCINVSSDTPQLIRAFKRYHLSQIEKEILLLLLLSCLCMYNKAEDLDDIQKHLNKNGKEALSVVRALSDNGRLVRSGLVLKDDDDSDIYISKKFMSSIVNKNDEFEIGWDVNTYEALLDRTYDISRTAKTRSETIEFMQRQRSSKHQIKLAIRLTEKFYFNLSRSLDRHPKWGLNQLIKSDLTYTEQLIVLVLIGKELGFFPSQDELYTGIGLARCVSEDVPSVRHHLSLLKQEMPLQNLNFIRVCGGMSHSRAVEDLATIQSCEYELTTESLKMFNVERHTRSSNSARKPLMRLDQLVLTEKIQHALKMCITQVQNNKTLLDTWGISKTINYGRGVTILFSGPPGTGKSACAEAIAHELNKPIFVINYAEIQNCWVGQTEKNIVRVFQEAKDADTVLFWDEADAMFYDRDTSMQNWEVRDVNVLLQELEKFEGVCILSTNRKGRLDKALERRISLKIDFERPSQSLRKTIWQKLIPETMPLAKNVSFDKLSQTDLSGGEIKNIVLNAARIALSRSKDSMVNQDDFMEAIKMETQGGWGNIHKPFGFSA